MIRTFTQNDLIKHIYQENHPEEYIEIETAALFDKKLAKELSSLQNTVMSVDMIEKSPSDAAIDKILSYSKSYDLHSLK